ncbi:hypothetical protein COW83_01865 [Candidatus Collierbacteria bacterium CG22_combo_CG10-13_8_21_14_all_43_12]|uniref:DNA 3'-5' helicase n=1 Tax=Candidatus Collierbacteria bacterium CG22_combo_CG10-13_8_21_14_all_43_12 TaxID=1974537 RepID=A0A2H0DUM7_9BACT|nr:MAG: hypothetical protein COW83_01865 [Candidatus Collierbacteria bacterium CG22_combo_CG10-13_8_21_14_all_43_12]
MPVTVAFESAYKKLNPTQKKAVDTIEGPVLVMAGPGTGKTQVLTVRIANILKETDADPGSILALTFTEAAAKEMKERLVQLIGKDGYHVKIGTFHAFCADIISENPERFSRTRGLQNASELEKIQVFKEILEKNSYEQLKPPGDPLFYLTHVRDSISDLKREGITVKKFMELVNILREGFELEKDNLKKTAFNEKEKLVRKNVDLLDIYEKYEKKLEEIGRFDFDDMINWVVEALETDEDFALKYQEDYQYLLADEYQDTNTAQNRLLFALTSHWGEEANIFCVGDNNQSIMRFQGASKENIQQFKGHFPHHTEITLSDNYRSTPTILNASAKLLDETPLNPTVSFKDLPIKVAKFSSPILEDEFIAESIKQKIRKGRKPREIAVIVKENKDIENLSDLFKQKKIPYRLQGGTNILNTPLVARFLKILTVVTTLRGPVDDLDLFTILNYEFFGLNPLSVLKIARTAYLNRETLADTLLDAHPEVEENVIDVFQSLISWNRISVTQTLTEVFQTVLQESGILEHILSLPQPVIELNRFGTLFEDVKEQAAAFPGISLPEYVFNLNVMEENNIRLEEQALLEDIDAVTLTTAHKAKGLEWHTVFIYKFADSYWGNKQKKQMIKLPPGIIQEKVDSEDKNEEVRRLFYVAMTRAKQQLYLTGAVKYPNSAKMIFPSIFYEDLPKECLRKLKTKKYETRAEKILADQLTRSPLPVLHEGEKDYLHEIIKNFKLSPTSLNTFLTCAYKFKLDHLYKIPRAKASAMCFGTAVHKALENLYLELKNTGKLEAKEDFLRDFEASLKKEIISEVDYKSRLEHGRKVLPAYYDFYEKEFAPALYTEKKFGESLFEIMLDDIPLSGKADRIDLVDGDVLASPKLGEQRRVRFVDYKTGKIRTRGEIEGTTKNSDGGYKRQLIFYHLLAELDKSFDYQIVQTELDFIEPKGGEFKKERFNITPEEVTGLKQVIRDSMAQIRALDFSRTTDLTSCVRCDFKNHCWPTGLPVTVETTEGE